MLKENQIIENIQAAKTKIRNEIRELKDRLKLAQENMQSLKEKVEAEEMTIEDNV
jgi:peptidoglycan hydrolase CwlO-like protein